MLQVGLPGARGVLGDHGMRGLDVVLRALLSIGLPVASPFVAIMGSFVLLLCLLKSMVGRAELGLGLVRSMHVFT